MCLIRPPSAQLMTLHRAQISVGGVPPPTPHPICETMLWIQKNAASVEQRQSR